MIIRLLHWLMPACAVTGSRGLPIPDPVVIAAIAVPRRSNAALAAPVDFQPRPDVVTRDIRAPAEELYDALLRMAAAQPRTFLAAAYPTRLQAHFVARSKKLNFPDVIVAEAVSRGDDASAAVIYSASVYGRSDFGVNRRRVATWLAALDATMKAGNQG